MKNPIRKRKEELNEREIQASQKQQSQIFPNVDLSTDQQRRIDIGEAIAQAIITLDKGDIKKFSFLDKEEEMVYSLWYSIADMYDLKMVHKFIINSLCMRVSINGKGRNDIVQIASAHAQSELSPERSFGGRIRSMIGI